MQQRKAVHNRSRYRESLPENSASALIHPQLRLSANARFLIRKPDARCGARGVAQADQRSSSERENCFFPARLRVNLLP